MLLRPLDSRVIVEAPMLIETRMTGEEAMERLVEAVRVTFAREC